MPDLPIVAHNVQYDFNEVLVPAFKKVRNLDRLPKLQRWRCTYKLSYCLPNILSKSLDNVLEELGYKRRSNCNYHDADSDALHCGKVYMSLILLQEPNKSHLGFY